MEKVSIPFYKDDSSIPLIRFLLPNGEEAVALLDSGADSTVFSKKLFEKYPDCFCKEGEYNSINFVDFTGGNKSMVVHERYLPISFSKDSGQFRVKGLVYDLSHISDHFKDVEISALFGTDTLDKIGAVVDFRNKTVKVDDIPCQ